MREAVSNKGTVNLEILVHFYKDFVKVVLDQGYYFISQ
jgi:hypothetical protein